MIKKIINFIKEDIKNNYKIYIFYLFIVGIIFIPFDYYIYSSGDLVDLSDRIKVENSYDYEGSFNLTYVSVRKANIYTLLLSYIIPGWDLEKIDDLRIDEDESSDEIFERDKLYLKETSYDAVIAAFEEANMPYKLIKNDVTVTYVYNFAQTNLKVGDVIKSINDEEVTDSLSISNIVSKFSENDNLNIKVIRNNKVIDCYGKIVIQKDKKLIGIAIANIKEVESTPKVEYIFKDTESGSSRGLMCAIDIYNKITEYDLTKGDIIAGTGSINEKGEVGAIDGVKYKLSGAVRNKAKVFIVPSKNYKEAIDLKENNNYDIEIIEADNLHNIIEKLKNR